MNARHQTTSPDEHDAADCASVPKHERLVILSIPFTRLTRLLLGAPVLSPLREHADVAIVSPQADNAVFRSEFAAEGTRFVRWRDPEIRRQPLRALFGLSERLRMLGYWRRFKRQGMAYYLAANDLVLGDDGRDQRMSPVRRLIYFVVGVLGMWPRAWRVVDRLVGPHLFDFAELRQIAAEYRQVTLIQSASWGVQDRMLASLARQQRWRVIFVPYTSDQLFCNGYLLADFDAVCVQGRFEERCAQQLHRVPPASVVRLGSAWFRHLELIARKLRGDSQPRKARARTILFAGVSRTYFPRASEEAALNELLRGIEDGRLENVTVVYRPVVADEAARQEVTATWEHRANLRLQWPQAACLAMSDYGQRRVDADLSEYVSQLLEADVIVMAGITSLCLDAAQLGIASIANMADPSGVLARRNTDLMFDAANRLIGYSALPVIRELSDLVPLVKQILNDSERSAVLARELAADWDYPASGFREKLIEAVTGPGAV